MYRTFSFNDEMTIFALLVSNISGACLRGLNGYLAILRHQIALFLFFGLITYGLPVVVYINQKGMLFYQVILDLGKRQNVTQKRTKRFLLMKRSIKSFILLNYDLNFLFVQMLAKADWMNGFLNGNSQENDLLIIRGWVLVLEVEDS